MRPLGDAAVMRLWEQGRTRHPIDRALLLFAAAAPDLAVDALPDAPIGQRDAAILDLRNASFGARIDAYGRCPECGERFEFRLDGRELRDAAPPAVDAAFVDTKGLRLRLPTSRDLAAAVRSANAAEFLARACCADDSSFDVASVADVAQSIAAQDPAADLRLALRCEACDHGWDESFDPAAYCWQEVEVRAARLFDEVHGLARAYGWTEDEVLRLGPARRATYLERCGA